MQARLNRAEEQVTQERLEKENLLAYLRQLGITPP